MMEPRTDPAAPVDMHVLDNPARHALEGPDARFAEQAGSVLRYRRDIAPFFGVPDGAAAGDALWSDAATLTGPDGVVVLAGPPAVPGPPWTVQLSLDGYQMIGPLDGWSVDPDLEPLGLDDAEAMMDLVRRTEPGPFLSRTVELGGYVGVKRGGRLLAMAGERMHPLGWTEISAVCTDPEARGQGLARKAVSAVAAGIVARGERPFLHVVATNPAARLYEAMGFEIRREITFYGVTLADPPAGSTSS